MKFIFEIFPMFTEYGKPISNCVKTEKNCPKHLKILLNLPTFCKFYGNKKYIDLRNNFGLRKHSLKNCLQIQLFLINSKNLAAVNYLCNERKHLFTFLQF